MEANKKCVRKSFLPHQYDGEELFLEKMHRDGWRFVKLYKGIPTKYEFEKCEPEEYVYQLDYIKTDEDTEVYHQLFLDAGWEEILEWNGVGGKWYYFIKKKEGQVRERIFTDVQSKIELINKLIVAYGGFYLLLVSLWCISINGAIIQFTTRDLSFLTITYIPLIAIDLIGIIFMTYWIVALVIKKSKLKKKEI